MLLDNSYRIKVINQTITQKGMVKYLLNSTFKGNTFPKLIDYNTVFDVFNILKRKLYFYLK